MSSYSSCASAMSSSGTSGSWSPTSSESDSEIDGAVNLREAKKQIKDMEAMVAPELSKKQKRHLCGWGEGYLAWSGPVY